MLAVALHPQDDTPLVDFLEVPVGVLRAAPRDEDQLNRAADPSFGDGRAPAELAHRTPPRPAGRSPVRFARSLAWHATSSAVSSTPWSSRTPHSLPRTRLRARVMVLPRPEFVRSGRGTLYSLHRKEYACSNAPSGATETFTVPRADTPTRWRVAGPRGLADRAERPPRHQAPDRAHQVRGLRRRAAGDGLACPQRRRCSNPRGSHRGPTRGRSGAFPPLAPEARDGPGGRA